MRIFLVAAFLALARAQNATTIPQTDASVQQLDADKCARFDPTDWRICYPQPKWTLPDPNIHHITGLEQMQFSWWYAWQLFIKAVDSGDSAATKQLNVMPKSYRRYLRKYNTTEKVEEEARRLSVPFKPEVDWREWYWQLSCPYTLHKLQGFYHTKYGQCWLMWSFKRPIIYATCNREHCATRCHYLFPQYKMSRCFETHFRMYTGWFFCPQIYQHAHVNYCLKNPWFCFRIIRFRLPKCCECLHCRYNGLNSVFYAKSADVEEIPVDADEDDDASNNDSPADNAKFGRGYFDFET